MSLIKEKKFLLLLACTYVGVKGLVGTLLQTTMLPFFKTTLQLDSRSYQMCFTVLMLPWTLKSLIGLVADRYKPCGTPITPFFGGSVLYGTASACILAVSLYSKWHLNVYGVLFLAFGISCQVAVNDLLTEGRYAMMMREHQHLATTIVSTVWWFMTAGAVVGTIITGVLATSQSAPYIPFAITAVFCAQNAIPLMAGSLDRRNINATPAAAVSGIVTACIAVSAAAIAMSVANLFASVDVQLCVCLLAVASAVGISMKVLPKDMAACNVYMCLANALYLGFPGAIDYWYTAPHTCVHGGPAFSMSYYILVSGLVGSACSAIGVLLYKRYFAGWAYRRVFQFTTILRCAGACVDIIMLNRWNIAVGIPDKVMYLCGNAMLRPVIMALDSMPMVTLTAQLCPEGSENTVYALLASFQNFGAGAANIVGMALSTYAGVTLGGGARCSYDNLSEIVTVGNMLLPLLAVPLTHILPDKAPNGGTEV